MSLMSEALEALEEGETQWASKLEALPMNGNTYIIVYVEGHEFNVGQ